MKLPAGYGRRRSLAQNLARIVWAVLIVLPLAAVLAARDVIRDRAPRLWAAITEPAILAALVVLLFIVEVLPWPRQ